MKKTLCLLVCALLCSCAEPCRHYWRTDVVGMPGVMAGTKKPYESVKLYQAKKDAPKHTVIGMISVQGSAGEEAAFIKAFLYRSADLGADGLIFYRDEGTYMKADNWNANTERAYRGEAIRFE